MCYNTVMKKDTKAQYLKKVNEVLYIIHKDISQNYSVDELSKKVALSPFHFNRIFKKITGTSLHSYIKKIRLEYAANSLLFNPDSTISDILLECGFASNSSFTHAFKKFFGVTPTKWREVDIPKNIIINIKDISPPKVKIVMLEQTEVVYIRHKGYDKSIKDAWMKLIWFCEKEGIEFQASKMIGLHHSNPNIVEPKECRYVACLKIDKKIYPKGDIGVMKIPKIVCAKFSLKGKYGDLLKYMDYIYYIWLPSSKYEKIHLPALAYYRKNHFIEEDERFDLDFYVPLRYK